MYRLILIFMFTVATVVWAQEDATDDEATTDSATETAEELTDDEFDDLDLDRNQDHTEEDEDIFKPTDVVSYQQSVPFPVDI